MSDTLIKGQEMLKAMYSFQATLAKTLSFNEGDFFILHQSKNKQRNWWQVVNALGQVGFVPSNYVNVVKVDPKFYISFINDLFQRMVDDGSELTQERRELIEKLVEKKEQAIQASRVSLEIHTSNMSTKKQAPNPPSSKDIVNGNSEDSVSNSVPLTPVENITPEPRTPDMNDSRDEQDESNIQENHIAGDREQELPNTDKKCDSHDASELAGTLYSIVDKVRMNTGLSHNLSRIAVESVLDSLKQVLNRDNCKDCSNVWSLASMLSVRGPLPVDMNVLKTSSDACQLRSDLTALVVSARDTQQRAWSLHDDEHIILKHIEGVISVLSNADPRVSCDVLSTDKYEYVLDLVTFYQMETRWCIRECLIKAFTAMCTLDRDAVKVLCSSILARELARDMLDNQAESERLLQSAKLMITTLSMGDPLPLSHFEQLDIEFVSFLLELIELPPASDIHENIPDQFLALVCALNLQFNDPDNNLILDALQMRSHSKTSTEKLLLLLNREDDPVRVLDHQPPAPHSVLKLTLDAFSRRSTAQLFYTNDTKVLLDITVRQLADLSAGDHRRGLYLQLCLGILRHTDYNHCHRQADLLRCFTRIFCEEGEISKDDQNLVRTISNEFPQYFKA